MRTKKGTHLVEFLTNAKCSNVKRDMDKYIATEGQHTRNVKSCSTIRGYEAARYVSYKFKLLSTTNSNYNKVSTYYQVVM